MMIEKTGFSALNIGLLIRLLRLGFNAFINVIVFIGIALHVLLTENNKHLYSSIK
jgi:hypothetical protein